MTFTELNKGATVDVFILAWNEEAIIAETIRHYYRHFTANIYLYDNQSADNTVKIAKSMGVTVRSFDTQGQIRDDVCLQIKNEAWKGSKADWVIVCDADEFFEAPFDCSKYTILNVKGYDVIGGVHGRLGVYNKAFNKNGIFRPSAITSINYSPGCHSCAPMGQISGSKEFATLMHRKYISEEYVLQKHLAYEKRLSDFNKKYEFGKEYIGVTAESIRQKFDELRSKAVEIP